jgi:hypothetical protein
MIGHYKNLRNPRATLSIRSVRYESRVTQTRDLDTKPRNYSDFLAGYYGSHSCGSYKNSSGQNRNTQDSRSEAEWRLVCRLHRCRWRCWRKATHASTTLTWRRSGCRTRLRDASARLSGSGEVRVRTRPEVDPARYPRARRSRTHDHVTHLVRRRTFPARQGMARV